MAISGISATNIVLTKQQCFCFTC